MSQPEGSSSRKTLTVAYLGPEASFSHQAAIEVFPPSTHHAVSLHPLPSFAAIFAAIQNSSRSGSQSSSSSSAQPLSQPGPGPEDTINYDYALLPIENSTNGSVVQVLDLIAQCGPESPALYPDVEVCAEYYLPVHHCLFVSPRSSSSSDEPVNNNASNARDSATHDGDELRRAIRTLYTHPQVWGQCARFLARHFSPKDVERIDVGSTSAAAQLVARDACSATSGGLNAAIASRLAGERHALVCLAENIEDEPGLNTTRFVVVRNRLARLGGRARGDDNVDFETVGLHESAAERKSQRESGKQIPRRYKSLITFTIPHTKPGALADALAVFKNCGFNLTSIDTRPSRKRNWQYVFFVECEDTSPLAAGTDGEGEGKVMEMLDDLSKFTESLRYLGRFVDRLPEPDGEGRRG
ncbi:hypothetical protein PV04_03832 [Phialophora macrospora]|uniref:prephenate dehydratase n=1 Tax=Phialophora macrospora TaxID=1851006 RepID=A0A0D2EBM4_9EURO|nr:hypothetical protein PV04_03832 [Phialophora macrospora]